MLLESSVESFVQEKKSPSIAGMRGIELGNIQYWFPKYYFSMVPATEYLVLFLRMVMRPFSITLLMGAETVSLAEVIPVATAL